MISKYHQVIIFTWKWIRIVNYIFLYVEGIGCYDYCYDIWYYVMFSIYGLIVMIVISGIGIVVGKVVSCYMVCIISICLGY